MLAVDSRVKVRWQLMISSFSQFEVCKVGGLLRRCLSLHFSRNWAFCAQMASCNRLESETLFHNRTQLLILPFDHYCGGSSARRVLAGSSFLAKARRDWEFCCAAMDHASQRVNQLSNSSEMDCGKECAILGEYLADL
jgi:hypothetical protein